MQAQILIAIDDNETLNLVTSAVSSNGHVTHSMAADAQALSTLKSQSIDVVIIDLETPSVDGLEILRYASMKVPSVPIIVIAGQQAARMAMASLRLGTVDHLDKPVAPQILHVTIQRALERGRLLKGINRAAFGLDMEGFGGLLGVSPAMQEVFEQIRHCAPFKTTVLITGESGTGKDLVARALHALSPFSQGPFLAINCSAIPRELVESQLFGHEKGAFTGADTARPGVFEAANGGTLFLDEIGDLASDAQAKLLRTLEDRQVTRLGNTTPIDVNVRLIAATHANLKRSVEERQFREDLYYRLNVLQINLVPLRNRTEDIPLLLRAFLDRFAQENSIPPKTISPEALDCLINYRWPGNVRELKNMAERLAITSKTGTIELTDIPSDLRPSQSEQTTFRGNLSDLKGLPLVEIEKILIEHTLEQNGGNRMHTAEILGISLRTLQRKLKEYKILV